MARLQINDVVKRYGKTEVVHGINLDIKDKEFVVFVGPSGCGKSTTLRMIAGLEEISDGTMTIGDKVINELAPKDRGVAMVFQNYALYPHMNVFDNMSFGLKIKKRPKEEIKRRVEEAAAILGLEEFLYRKPSQLSGGQRQRVAMGRAIVRRPDIFLFDEPLSNLDAKLRTQMRIEMKKLHRRVDATIIYVTHDQVEAMTLGDRIVVMKDGHIVQQGKPLELFEKPVNTFVAGFIGSPPMNLVPAVVKGVKGGLSLEFEGEVSLPVPDKEGVEIAPGQEVVVGIRAEDLTLESGEGRFPEDWKLPGVVDVVEPLGNETHVHVDLGGARVLAKCDGRRVVAPGDAVRVEANLNQLHIFDAETTMAIY
ncbi:ABC transporter ATP-binding protein [Desulfoluna spongiiphila]|uniref:Carbohydrate ABC transporter ATP-binding protein, CUT1 family n=1 Tax=Desulfoluna spongiiphila TaxID=419481 RepID=A0A1G5FX57_9BACT|nr:sn-glycerol-3-phosphate ABC transporter ATP-binding protein UgpC [Desulfoluna spongiiphila]SCY43843.1 carbohydrate ABC transporter ATP-binding protein, CUT1 family [Desulfoluna spongiiphila]